MDTKKADGTLPKRPTAVQAAQRKTLPVRAGRAKISIDHKKADARLDNPIALDRQALDLIESLRASEKMLAACRAKRAELDSIERAAIEQRQRCSIDLVQHMTAMVASHFGGKA